MLDIPSWDQEELLWPALGSEQIKEQAIPNCRFKNSLPEEDTL